MILVALTISVDAADLPVIVVKGLQVFVAVEAGACESHVIGAKSADVFEVFILYELYHDVLLRLNLEHFQDEAKERCGSANWEEKKS